MCVGLQDSYGSNPGVSRLGIWHVSAGMLAAIKQVNSCHLRKERFPFSLSTSRLWLCLCLSPSLFLSLFLSLSLCLSLSFYLSLCLCVCRCLSLSLGDKPSAYQQYDVCPVSHIVLVHSVYVNNYPEDICPFQPGVLSSWPYIKAACIQHRDNLK